ncbi:MAG: hypothetical protein QG570_389 [Patescibacteria group bacterium]|nr:hypothetical protein [Patescibacteria group bacterium]
MLYIVINNKFKIRNGGDIMNNQLVDYIKKNLTMVIAIMVVGFVLLVLGEFYLYRQQMYLNKMISEGFMQLKESQEKMQTDTQIMQEEVNETDAMMQAE